MTELQSIARFLRRSEDQLRVSYDLIRQGYAPEFLATYRADETGQIDRETLKKIKRIHDYYQRVENHRKFVKEMLTQEQLWGEQLEGIVQEAGTIAEIDLVTRGLRSRKSSRALVDKQVEISRMGQAILTMEGEAPADLVGWVAEQANVDLEEAKTLLAQVRRWLQLLLHEEPKLLDKIARHLRRRSIVTVMMLQTPENGDDAPDEVLGNDGPSTSVEVSGTSGEVDSGSSAISSEPSSSELSSMDAIVEEGEPNVEESDSIEVADPSADDSHLHEMAQGSEIVDSAVQMESLLEESSNLVEEAIAGTETIPANELSSESAAPATAGPSVENLTFAPPRSKKGSKKSSKPKEAPAKSKSEANLSPRQRRRRWLRSVLEGYVKLRKPLDRLSPYQILMLGRGQRSQLIKLNLEYDIAPLIHAAREALCNGRHPLHHWLLELAEEGLRKQILPKLEQDLMAEYEEVAHQELMDLAVEHLEECLGQKPIHGRTIMVIDAIGPKSAALAVVDKDGKVLHTDEIPCNSIRSEILTANVTLLGEISHRFHVQLVALSNGPARRFLIHTVKELLKQSSGRLQWSMVDRAGADAYGATRLCLQELPSISRRHRSAVWLARRMQDPLCELLKIDPARLRLGSYQRELPETLLQESLQHAVSEAISKRGIDVWHASEVALAQIPGVTPEIAKKIIGLRDSKELTTRQALIETLKADWSEMNQRQALGFLRLFGSDEPLDATPIHPDDYRLAERLISNAGVPVPPNAPPGWSKPTAPTSTAIVEEAPSSEPIDAEVSTDGLVDAEQPVVDSSTDEANSAPSEPVADSSGTGEATAEVSTPDGAPAAEATSAVESTPAVEASAPEVAIDVEKLSRSWQVGRERMRYVARALQRPFADVRSSRSDIPMLDRVPSMEDLKQGMTSWAVIIGVADFGAFADLGPDCSGLIHVSRLSPNFVEDPHQVVQVGDLIQVWVVDVDTNKKRVALSALPPGTQQRPRREFGGDGPEGQRNEQSGHGQGQGQGQRGRGNEGNNAGGNRRGGDNRRTDSGGRRDSQGKPGFAGRSGSRQGQGDSRGRGRRDQYEGSNQGSSHERKVKIDPPKPIQPISDAMQKGKEPLRSFSDLMQFIQVKREPGDQEPTKGDGAADS